jgi:sortase (surface protein transpeptidase)
MATATVDGMASRPTPTASLPTPTATTIPLPEAGRAQQARFAPIALAIPRIGVDARIVSVGVTPEGQLEAPADYSTVGWYAAGTLPGEPGSAVLDGHLDSRTGPAVFYRLGELAVGDEIIVRMGAGRDDLRFVVTESALFWTDEAPLDRIYGASEQPELVLITCDGPFDGGGGGYLQRRVIFATLADSAPS